jgi:hypothetical protein
VVAELGRPLENLQRPPFDRGCRRALGSSPTENEDAVTPLADWIERYLLRTREVSTVALSSVPLILVYGLLLPVASPWARSGVDLISGPLLAELSTLTWVAIQVAIALALFAFAIDRRQHTVREHLSWSWPPILEACLWGLSLGGLVLFLMDEVHLLSTSAPQTTFEISLIDRIVISAGAGLHEELLFRLLALPLVSWLLSRALGVPRRAALIGAVILSSLGFSLAHHFAGEPLDAFVFAYRLTAGLVFATLFVTRGFAVTAWAHAAYDFSVI